MIIPRDDGADNAERLTSRITQDLLAEGNRLSLKFTAQAAEVANYVDRRLRFGACLGAQRIAALERDGARKLLDPRFKCICYPGEKPPALARNRARPGGKSIGRGFHRARGIFGAAPRHLGDWTPVRWIFNFEALSTHLPPINMRSFLGAVSSSRILVTAGIVISIVSSVAAIPPAALQL
jgi:hypothetical protein